MPASDPNTRVLPVITEELKLGRRLVKTGSVRVDKRVQRTSRLIEAPLVREFVDVRHVPKNHVVESVPPVRKVGSTLVIPVVEEELVVTKRLVLKEEIHLIRRRETQQSRRTVEVDREIARVVRLDAEGNVIEAEDPAARTILGSRPRSKRG